MLNNFSSLGINKEMEAILKNNGITEPSPVQVQAIPVLLAGKDIVAQAQTGTGKTLAFLLPILEGINPDTPHVQSLIITPTRELAIQITAEIKKIVPDKSVNVLGAYGGQDIERQIRKLKGNIQIVVGTPGRLLDHLRRRTVELKKISTLVLDEADRMLDMGFSKDVELIIKQTSPKHQTMLFSATISRGVKVIASKFLKEPVHVHIQSKNIILDEISQIVIETTDRAKQDALCKVIDEDKPFMAIIFCRTKRRASTLNSALQARGYNSDELHGDIAQSKREKVMKAFRKTNLHLLVATDVAARGLDVEGITHIYNYDIPENAESYIHRIGRTGRAGQVGVATTFVTSKDMELLNIIQEGIKTTLKRRRIEVTISRDISTNHEPTTRKSFSNRATSGKPKSDKISRLKKGKLASKESHTESKRPSSRSWSKPRSQAKSKSASRNGQKMNRGQKPSSRRG